MTVEGLKTIFGWIAVILLFLTFAAGAGALITGSIINKRQTEEIRRFGLDLKDKDVKIAEAQRAFVDANTKAEGLRLDIAKANERAAEANRIAESERLERIKIEERLRPWSFYQTTAGSCRDYPKTVSRHSV